MLKALWHVLPRRRLGASRAVVHEAGTGGGEVLYPPDSSGMVRRVRGEGAIELRGVRQTLGLGAKKTLVLDGVDAIFPRGRAIGVLGGLGSGKSTLVQILTGNIRPEEGQIVHGMRVSWPMNARHIFRKDMSIRGNVRFLCAIYGAWAPDMIEAVKEIGKIRAQDIDTPLVRLAPDFTARAATSLCYALDFDCYVADDGLCVGGKPFRDQMKALMLKRQKTHSLIIASRNASAIRDLCDDFYILEDGKLKMYGSRREAFKAFTGISLTARLDPRGEAGDDEL